MTSRCRGSVDPDRAVAPARVAAGGVRGHAGFTLFEVAISAGLVAACVVSTCMLMPVGLRAQQQARFRLYAGCKVIEIVDTFANHDHTYDSHQLEAEKLGQNTMPLKLPIDLDRMMLSPQLGLLPLPDAIAARIDSDGDEIARILAEGGRVFFASPIPYEVGFHQRAAGLNLQDGPLSLERVPPPEAQSVLFGIVGYAQQNGLPSHPCLAWPYGAIYPSAPSNGGPDHAYATHGSATWEWLMWGQDAANPLDLSGVARDCVDAMCDALPTHEYWCDWNDPVQKPYVQDLAHLQGYIDNVQKLVVELGIPCTGTAPYLLPDPPADLTTKPKPWSPTDLDIYPDPRRVSAIRWLAAGALMRTGYYTKQVWPVTTADIDYATATQEVCMRWAMRYAATNPYDWGAPRPLNHCGAWDFPLLQFDLFAPRPVGDGTGDVTWAITAPRKPVNYARAYSVWGAGATMVPDNHAEIDASWAGGANGFDGSHFNLTQRFAAAERCRQIVCWAADWKAYEDFETAPSGPWDSSTAYMDSRGNYVDRAIAQHPPDRTLVWAQDPATTPDPTRLGPDTLSVADPLRDTAAYRLAFFGCYGADRNGNGVLDHGPLPKTARIRAVEIGRWNFYDRRVVSALRN